MSIKVLIIHRQYRIRGGEDSFLDEILKPALKASAIDFECLTLPPLLSSMTDLVEVFGMITGLEKFRPSFWRCMSKIVNEKFTHVILNNCIPTISLSLPKEIRKKNLKTLTWVHNFRLDCANGLRFNGKEFCTLCLDKGSHWSIIQNCQRNFFQSLLYALVYRRSRVARTFIPFIDGFICNSDFTKIYVVGLLKKLNLEGQASVLPMPTGAIRDEIAITEGRLSQLTEKLPKPFYIFLGRLSFEKGADLFLNLAKKYPDRGFLMCGEGPMLEELKKTSLENFVMAGVVSAQEKPWLFKNCEALIIPSRLPETSSLVIAESQAYGTPIVYPRGGGAEETFKRLGRTGCSLDEFTGQKFSKSFGVTKGSSLNDFGFALALIFIQVCRRPQTRLNTAFSLFS